MTLEEKKIVLVAGHYMSWGSDEEVLKAYRRLESIEDEHGDEFASDYVSMWGPLGTLSVKYTLRVINAALFGLEKFLIEYKNEIIQSLYDDNDVSYDREGKEIQRDGEDIS